MSKPTWHLTFTGFYAGVTLCGISGETKLEQPEGTRYVHASLWFPEKATGPDYPQREDICPECLALFDEPADSEEDEHGKPG